MHYKAQANLLFYLLAFLFIFIFLVGLLGMIRLWRLGKAPTLNREVKILKWVVSFFKASLLETQILEYGTLAWLAHMMIFWGVVSLVLLTAVHFILNWFIPSSSAIFHYYKTGNVNLVMAFWGDFWGLILLSGILIALFRRYILRPKTLNTISDDWVALLFLFVITVTGFFTEAVRLAVRPAESDAIYSFAVNWIIPFLRKYNWNEAMLTLMFYIHGILSLICIAYVPFSKFRHVFASPLVYSFVTAGNRYSKESWLKRRGAQ